MNKKGWKGLIDGRLLESDCKDKYIYDNKKDSEIGIHIYHIRKESSITEFYKYAMEALTSVLLNLKYQNKLLKVTENGIGLFFNIFNCKESAVIKNEYVLMKNGGIELAELNHFGELECKLLE